MRYKFAELFARLKENWFKVNCFNVNEKYLNGGFAFMRG